MKKLTYLSGYSEKIQSRARRLLDEDRLGEYLLDRYPECHRRRTEKALYDYAMELKNRFMRQSPTLDKVVYDPHLHVIHQALGIHARVSRVQGSRLKAKKEIRVAVVFKNAPQAFLDMILVHELAHFKETDHNRAFYKLCLHMEPDYHQLELDTRLFLTYRECVGELYG